MQVRCSCPHAKRHWVGERLVAWLTKYSRMSLLASFGVDYTFQCVIILNGVCLCSAASKAGFRRGPDEISRAVVSLHAVQLEFADLGYDGLAGVRRQALGAEPHELVEVVNYVNVITAPGKPCFGPSAYRLDKPGNANPFGCMAIYFGRKIVELVLWGAENYATR
jgi:hypothetical protein